MPRREFRFLLLTLSICSLLACQSQQQQSGLSLNPLASSDTVSVARFNVAGELIKPVVDEWIFMGTALGQRYEDEAFNTEEPGSFQVVHMEPTAYASFKETGEYADGTMFSLSFYDVEKKAAPQLSGYSQQDLNAFEIHLIDKTSFIDQRAFYLFSNESTSTAMIPAGNDCVQCHNAHGQYDGTFTQFYPIMRSHMVNKSF